MVKAGDTVDQMIDALLPHLEAGDIIIDGGNSLFTDSNRRTKALREKGILVRDRSYEIPGCVRVTVGTREQMRKFLTELEAVWKRPAK
jgi:6-phosphogluconate dehydrogenase (decarboxylating)